MKPTTPGGKWWYGRIEQRAYMRLAALRRPRPGGRSPLWDGRPPVPVEHVAEHLLGLTISYDTIEERDGEAILGSLRPEAREIVLNDRHADRFREVPGSERHTIGHECGHADWFADVATATEQVTPPELAGEYHPHHRSATRGPVHVLRLLHDRSRGRPPEIRTTALWRMRDMERQRIADGQDSPRVRRAVDHYAATLLMPEDLVRAKARGLDLSRWSAITDIAAEFVVSKESLCIRLSDLGLIHDIDDDGRVLLHDPREAGQLDLL